jgi:Adenylosuccinate lyase
MRALYDSKSKTIDDRGLGELLSKDEMYKSWLIVEAALAKAQAENGFIPMAAAEGICEGAKIENIDFVEMDCIYQEIGHGFMPFLKVLDKACPGDSGKYVHYGITTQNVQQTGQQYVMKKIHKKFLILIAEILTNLAKLAHTHKDTVMPGRTHGRHATPITYGYKVAVWITDFMEATERLIACESRVFTVMMGGAVGTFSEMPEVGPAVQARVAELLEMTPMKIPSRNFCSHKVEYIMNLSLLASACHKIAEEVYSTTLEEIAEVSEGFKRGTVGSSTMPHKINPKLAKGIIGNSQKLYSLNGVGLQSSVRPYEGDSSSYMVFDAILEEALQCTTEILLRCEELTRTITPHPEKMLQNVNINKGLDNSEYVMMQLGARLGKNSAHELLYEIAIKTAADGEDFYTNLRANETIRKAFSEDEIRSMINPSNYIGCASLQAAEYAENGEQMAKKIMEHCLLF